MWRTVFKSPFLSVLLNKHLQWVDNTSALNLINPFPWAHIGCTRCASVPVSYVTQASEIKSRLRFEQSVRHAKTHWLPSWWHKSSHPHDVKQCGGEDQSIELICRDTKVNVNKSARGKTWGSADYCSQKEKQRRSWRDSSDKDWVRKIKDQIKVKMLTAAITRPKNVSVQPCTHFLQRHSHWLEKWILGQMKSFLFNTFANYLFNYVPVSYRPSACPLNDHIYDHICKYI